MSAREDLRRRRRRARRQAAWEARERPFLSYRYTWPRHKDGGRTWQEKQGKVPMWSSSRLQPRYEYFWYTWGRNGELIALGRSK